MTWLSDNAMSRLRDAGADPDLATTPYRLIQQLGRGGMSVVYLVEDPRLGRQVAMKVLEWPNPSGDLEPRLRREAQVLARLEHPGIVPVHDIGTLPDGRSFYTMKFVQGRRLDEAASEIGSLPLRLRLFAKICDPVGFANSRGILHRDLKPANIMIGPFGEVLVMDWGVAKVLEEVQYLASSVPSSAGPDATSHGSVVGTAGYMSPEQSRGDIAQLTARSDVYSLGAILRFLTVGKAIPRQLAAIIARATALEPESRYDSASALAADVSAFLDNSRVSAYPESLIDSVMRIVSRNRLAIGLVMAYLALRILLILWTAH